MKLLVGDKTITDIEMNTQLPKIDEARKLAYGTLYGLECEELKVDSTIKIIVKVRALQQNITTSIPLYCFE